MKQLLDCITAQFNIKDKKFGTINFNFNPTSATLEPSK